MLSISKYPRFGLALVLLLTSGVASALDSDLESPVELEADKVDLDANKGIAIYSGNVKLTQGSIKITANRIEVQAVKGQIQSADITGNSQQQAYFEQEVEPERWVKGQADQIILQQGQEDVTFKGNAVVNDGTNKISAPYIHYNSLKHKINANAQGNDNGRVKMIFAPGSLPGGQ